MDAMEFVPLSLSSSEDELQAWHTLNRAYWLEEMPGVDPPGELESRSELDGDLGSDRGGLLALDGETVVGMASYQLPLLEDREDAWLWVFVPPTHRSRGVGRRLFDAATATLSAGGRTRLIADVLVGGPGEVFAKAVGARVTQVDIGSVLEVAPVDADDLHHLAVPDPSYAVVRWVDRCPEELVGRYAEARMAMNDAPQGDEHHDDARWDAERVRDLEARRNRWAMRTYTAAAVHTETGDVAGYTELMIVDRPTTALQEDTGVLAAHRGHRLGLALKATNLLTLRTHEPQITRVLTWNAETNRHMRAVNERLGFQVMCRWLDLSLTR